MDRANGTNSTMHEVLHRRLRRPTPNDKGTMINDSFTK